MSGSHKNNHPISEGGGKDDRGPPARDRSRSRSPPPRRGSSGRRRSRSRSYSRSRSPPERRGSHSGGRRRSSPPRGRGYRGRSRSYSGSRSRSPPSRGGWSDRDRGDRGYRDDYDRRGPPPGHGGRGPPPGNSGRGLPSDDYRGGRGGYDDRGRRDDYGPPRGGGGHRGHGPPRYDPYHDRPSAPRDAYGPPRGGAGPPPPQRGGDGRRGPQRGGGGGGGGGESRRREEGEGIPGISLLVRNIGPTITNQDLGMAFGRIGDVRDVYIPRDYHSQQPKGFAFIEYADANQAREARDEMNRFRIKGCELEVVFAQEQRKSANEMRGRVVNQQNAGNTGKRRDRSSSFERHQKQRRRDDGRRREPGNKEKEDNRSGDNDNYAQEKGKLLQGKDGEN